MTNCHIFQLVTLARDVTIKKGWLANIKLKKGEKYFVTYYPIFAGNQMCQIIYDSGLGDDYLMIPKAALDQADQDRCRSQVIR